MHQEYIFEASESKTHMLWHVYSTQSQKMTHLQFDGVSTGPILDHCWVRLLHAV